MIRRIICVNSIVTILLATVFCIYPSVRAGLDLQDRALQQPGTPKMAWRLFRNLTPRYAAWAKDRLGAGRAEGPGVDDIPGTEWPLFGSVFYLWASDNLQRAWEAGDHTGGSEPKVFAREAIVSASELVIDPRHASWVKKHWGQDYLHRENVFYRMLVMAALTTRAKLLQDNAHLDLLRDQVETFVQELDASESGLLEDYPGECYPGDVMAAVMCIKRADAVLGTDHSAFVARAVRGFTGNKLTRHQLPPYAAIAKTGMPASQSRGCATSYFCLTAPELWPGRARQWYELYDRLFWQERATAVGFREFPKDIPQSDWMFDVDAGPVVAGYGVAANAFGVGATRKIGRFDRAYPLAAEMIASVVELPNGVLALPRVLSDWNDAPLLGEAAILWQLTVQPERGFTVKTGGEIPTYVRVVLISLFVVGIWRIWAAIGNLWQILRPSPGDPKRIILAPRFQSVAWSGLMLVVVGALVVGYYAIGIAVLAIGTLLPATKKKKPPTGAEDWPEKPGKSEE